ncbi:hypothetical protein GDO81_026107 [Engystomops pustulosus]|uniref:EGF-like domain-containing protein n=1 Tax=Engystomops pustulosus TaxID=76066 RepID=A0AAV6YGE3_ENGPU|nr:hypothetical protein GDO81_026107 [Engystomops pustulosus]
MRGSAAQGVPLPMLLHQNPPTQTHRRRICSSGTRIGSVWVTQSLVQPVYKPLITVCEGLRVCSTYRTTYKISYRQISRKMALPLYSCCPGWWRAEGHSCSQVSCPLPCHNGGACVGYNQCRCSEGWSGVHCQTGKTLLRAVRSWGEGGCRRVFMSCLLSPDVDECESGQHHCSQSCINTSGSFRCGCSQGFYLSDDGGGLSQSGEDHQRPPNTPTASSDRDG